MRCPRVAKLVPLMALLGLWQALTVLGLPEYVLGPVEIIRHFVNELASGELAGHVAASLTRSLPGFAVGTTLGLALGFLAGVTRRLDEVLSPVIFLTYPVPKIALLPIVMVWFGIGDLSKVIVIALACFYPAFINAYYGARATPTIMVWSARNMGARRYQIFLKVVVPSALPMMFAGVRVSLALSFILLFAAEMINAPAGLGFLIREAEGSLRFDLMYVSILMIALLGYLSDSLLRATRRRVLAWQVAEAE